ncbi:hypothetical protein AB0A60_25790 [Streptomyces sp. NPDC046275]|uniref:hypothetical protein n=1 Tax=Streptomyces sp. NPDC046275 TaxID=3157201 RepID=UPI003404728B
MTDTLRAPRMTEAEIDELRALREGYRVTDAFLVRLATHYTQAEIDGVVNPARHLAEYLGVQRQTVLTYMRMARRTGVLSKTQP